MPPWTLMMQTGQSLVPVITLPEETGALSLSAVDRTSQEDSLHLAWSGPGDTLRIETSEPAEGAPPAVPDSDADVSLGASLLAVVPSPRGRAPSSLTHAAASNSPARRHRIG